jgi:serine/threonine protein kinase
MELMKGGHLGSFIAQRRRLGRPVEEHEAVHILKQVLKAILHLHENNIIHRDIKPENILLDSFEELGTVKISDFGLSLQFDPNISTGFENRCGTEMYKSPEQLVQRTYHKVRQPNNEEPIDLWGLGVVGYMLLSEGKHPFAEGPLSSKELLRNIQEGELPFPRGELTEYGGR